jgi:hypothetical protein
METPVAKLITKLEGDPWRKGADFSADIREANEILWAKGGRRDEIERCLLAWIQRNQPCLFGKAAAKMGLLRMCILDDSDLLQGDASIREKIQSARLEWTRAGYEGRASGFVIAVMSKRIAMATPGPEMMALARRLCELYLIEEEGILPDKIYMDRIYLEKPGSSRRTWWWHAGVNYFCAQGDARWWHDHRFPGGLAFSMNSVGHMMKAGRIAAAMDALDKDLGITDHEWIGGPWQDLGKALQVAMQTISQAAPACSGKATRLVPTSESAPALPCPVDLRGPLSQMNHCEYRGYYHTDFTLPSSYFVPNIERPHGAEELKLDFTYLFHRSPENPAFFSMGEGIQIRAGGEVTPGALQSWAHQLKAHPGEMDIDEVSLLRIALGQQRGPGRR